MVKSKSRNIFFPPIRLEFGGIYVGSFSSNVWTGVSRGELVGSGQRLWQLEMTLLLFEVFWGI